AADLSDRVVRVAVAADMLVGGEDRLHRLDMGVAFERRPGGHPLVAERAEHDALDPRHVERLQPGARDPVEQAARGLGGGIGLENDDHRKGPWRWWATKNPPLGAGPIESRPLRVGSYRSATPSRRRPPPAERKGAP